MKVKKAQRLLSQFDWSPLYPWLQELFPIFIWVVQCFRVKWAGPRPNYEYRAFSFLGLQNLQHIRGFGSTCYEHISSN